MTTLPRPQSTADHLDALRSDYMTAVIDTATRHGHRIRVAPYVAFRLGRQNTSTRFIVTAQKALSYFLPASGLVSTETAVKALFLLVSRRWLMRLVAM